MKTLAFITLCFGVLPLNIIAQKYRTMYKLPTNNYSLFCHKDSYFFISKDTTYETKDAIHWEIYPNKIHVGETILNAINTDSCTYVFYSSGGDVYTFDGENFTPLYQQGDFRNQNYSEAFAYENKICLFGGYGLFTHKNIITYFDTNLKEWDVFKPKNKYEEFPYPRAGSIITQVNNHKLYMGLGQTTRYYSKSYAKGLYNEDFWTFDFLSRKWTKLGNLIETFNFSQKSVNYKKNESLITLTEYQIYGVNISENKFIEYPQQIKIDSYNPYLIYNSYTDKILVVKNKHGLMDSVKIYTPEQLLGKKQIVSKLYKPVNEDQNKFLAGTAFFLLITGISVFYYRKKYKKLPIYTQIHRNVPKIEALLEEDEYKIFKLIFDNYPNKIPYLELMSQADYKVSYDTQKKKLKTSLDEIDNKIQELLNLEESIFIYSKNEIDKRMKEVRIC